jgi:tRNA uracil 4-sulfurtransferase
MIYDRIVIKYGEMLIKGKNKKFFIDQTIRTIKHKCKHIPHIEFEKYYDRLLLILNGADHHEVIRSLDKVFGLHSYSLAVRCENDLDQIKAKATELIETEIKQEVTFKVDTNRAYKPFPMGSMDVSKDVSKHVLRQSPLLKVDVRNPQVTLKIDIRQEGTYLTLNEISGLGGLPIGIDGKGLLMLSGGIDSPVAGFLALKRGIEIEAIHFASPPFTTDLAKQKVIDLLSVLSAYSRNSKIKLHVIPFTNLQKAIYENCPPNYGITIMRRMMYRISERVAKLNKAFILVNGESVGQVASQTLDSLFTINHVTNMPIIRPVATMDKQEIIKVARKIDTYDISIRPHEDCCTIFVPTNPVTKPDVTKAYHYEKAFDYEALITEAIENIEEIVIEEGLEFQLNDAVLNDLF